MNQCSIQERKQSITESTFTDSLSQAVDAGVRNSKQNILTYEDIFYRTISPKNAMKRKQMIESSPPRIYGFPSVNHPWCNSKLKAGILDRPLFFSGKPEVNDGQKINIVHYVGIAADEPKRIKKHIDKPNMVLPLVQIGWDEALCGLEAQYMDMLAPTYTDSQLRDGCWFCHNQGIGQLRNLRKNYPDLWALLMKWDSDSPVTFHADGHTVHDFDKRFALEDAGLITPDDKFRWKMIEEDYEHQLKLF